jgi:hypothetical protein
MSLTALETGSVPELHDGRTYRSPVRCERSGDGSARADLPKWTAASRSRQQHPSRTGAEAVCPGCICSRKSAGPTNQPFQLADASSNPARARPKKYPGFGISSVIVTVFASPISVSSRRCAAKKFPGGQSVGNDQFAWPPFLADRPAVAFLGPPEFNVYADRRARFSCLPGEPTASPHLGCASGPRMESRSSGRCGPYSAKMKITLPADLAIDAKVDLCLTTSPF